jgi:hypothetical protein
MEAYAFGLGEGPAKVVSVSLPEGTVHALREIAGPRGLSALVDAAVQQYVRNRLTAAYLESYQQEQGAFTADERRSAADLWTSAERLAARQELRQPADGPWPATG